MQDNWAIVVVIAESNGTKTVLGLPVGQHDLILGRYTAGTGTLSWYTLGVPSPLS